MHIPKLVESHIKRVTHINLRECHELKMKYYSILFNISCFIFITLFIGGILYYKYNNHVNIQERQKKENEKRNYILYNLRKFQNIKNKHITNIPFD